MGKFRGQAIRDVAAWLDEQIGTIEGFIEGGMSDVSTSEESGAILYAVQQRELVLEQAETIKELREAIVPFLRHKDGCLRNVPSMYQLRGVDYDKCDCGLEAALEAKHG